jgi:CO/xanthine dehydrogenase FAD-binding subunit
VGSYRRPHDLTEALAALAAGPHMIVAGGTDYYPARVGQPLDDDVLDISGLGALRAITDEGPHWRLPALASWSDVIAAELPALFDGLKLAAREVGGVQIQNAGTICGNLCNASPAADGMPNLLAMDAVVELASASGTRQVTAGDFVTGNRRTLRRPDELVTAILVPKPRHKARSGFVKLGARRYLVISIVMAAGVIETAPDNSVAAVRIAVGACSAVAQRLPALEAALVGRPFDRSLTEVVAPGHLAPLSPIDDIRASADYRNDAAVTMVRRLLAQMVGANP